MAKHYSGKRVAGRKPVGKRALSLLMALVMSLSLVQITAFAVDETEPTDDLTNQVVLGGGFAYYDKTGKELETSGDIEPEDWVVKVERTLENTAVENLLDVTLKVTTKDSDVSTDTDAATVLAIDLSNSMRKCATCGKDKNDPAHEGQEEWVRKCYFKDDSTWDPDGNGLHSRCKNCGEGAWAHYWDTVMVGADHAYQSRLDAAKQAATIFLSSYALNADGKVSTAPRYVSIVTFHTLANSRPVLEKYWVDVTDEDSLAAAKMAIENLKLPGTGRQGDQNGGTNTDAGLQMADNMLSLSTVSAVENKFVVMLTDGVPTFYIKEGGDRSSNTQIPQNDKSWGKYDFAAGPGDDSSSETTGAVEAICKQINAKIYGVTYGDIEDVKTDDGNQAITEWLENDCGLDGVYSVTNISSLNSAFKNILAEIQDGSVNTTVVTAANSVTGENGIYSIWNGVYGAEVSGNTINWALTDETEDKEAATQNTKTYVLSYYVWINTGANGFVNKQAYSLGDATLTYQVANGAKQTAKFPNVSGRGYLAGLTFTKVDSADHDKKLSGAEFKLEVCDSQYPTHSKKLTATSDENGVVTFESIPSGYEYTLYETKAPTGYDLPEDYISFVGVTDGEASAGFDGEAYVENEFHVDKVTVTVNHHYTLTTIAEDGTSSDSVTDTLGTPQEQNKDTAYTAALAPNGYTLKATKTTVTGDTAYTTAEDGTVSGIASENVVVDYYYYLTTDNRVATSMTVDHVYITKNWDDSVQSTVNGDTVTVNGYVNEVKNATIVPNGFTLVKATLQQGDAPAAELARTGEENYPVTLVAGVNKVVFTYEKTLEKPVEYTYTVEHVYLAPNGSVEGRVVLDKQGPVGPGTVVAASRINPIYKHTVDGTEYTYELKSRSADITVNDNNQKITLTYQRSSTPINPPVGPTVTYYSVTVNYYDKASGETIHTPYTDSKASGSSYDVTAQDKIAIEGYTYVETSGDALTGTLDGNKVINVYYSKTTDIDDGDTPTTPAEPGSDIGDDDVPTTPAQPPKTGDSMGLWIAAALVSGMGLVWLSLSGKKRKEEV